MSKIRNMKFNRGIIFIILFLFLFLYFWFNKSTEPSVTEKDNEITIYSGGRTYNRHSPLIFIGGMPRSGTTLMRTLLDAHPDIRCGAETFVIPQFTRMVRDWSRHDFFVLALREAEITENLLLKSSANFILGVMAGHGPSAPVLCDKEPFNAARIQMLYRMFPNSKHIVMIRDGRAVIHSIMTQHVKMSHFNHSTQSEALRSWNRVTTKMIEECRAVGDKVCMMVLYEQLVLHPEKVTKEIFGFLGIDWIPDLLHHDELIRDGREIPLSQ